MTDAMEALFVIGISLFVVIILYICAQCAWDNTSRDPW